MIELECPMCSGNILVELHAVELSCAGCAVTVDLIERPQTTLRPGRLTVHAPRVPLRRSLQFGP